MRKAFIICLIILLPFFSKGQNNLVPNWSFENLISCPNELGEIYKAPPWFSAYKDTAECSTDLYNICNSGQAGVPYNYLNGYQFPKTGSSYAGFIPYILSSSAKEYAEVQLITSLAPGKSYCVSFYVNFANAYSCSINSIGAAFSEDSLISLTPPFGDYTINVNPDILSDTSTIINDTLSWTKVGGVYECNSLINFITIGNFFDDSVSTHVTCGPVPTYVYYYLDDVSVVEVSNANAGNDTSMCVGETIPIGGLPTFEAEYTWYELADSINSGSIDSIHIAKPHVSPTQTTTYVMWKRQCNVETRDTMVVTVNCVGIKKTEPGDVLIYPNPANERISISCPVAADIYLTDILGKEIKTIRNTSSARTDLEISDLSNGVYFISVMERNRLPVTRKIIVQH